MVWKKTLMLQDLSDYIMIAELQELMHITLPAHIKRRAITLAHTRFIKKSLLEGCAFKSLADKCSDLKGYLPLHHFAKEVGVSWKTLDHRICFMRKTNLKLFEYKLICNRVMIFVGDELIQASQKAKPFYLTNFQIAHEYGVKEIHRVGDIMIGFY